MGIYVLFLKKLKISTGAYDDLEKVSDLSYAIVSKLGMNDRIGLRGFKIEDYVKTISQETLKVDFLFFVLHYLILLHNINRKLMMKSIQSFKKLQTRREKLLLNIKNS